MSDQPEALRLADELVAPVGTQSTYSVMQQAADELRRLHTECEALRAALKFIADHDLRGTDLTVAGYIAHALIGKACAALKEAK